MYICNVQQKTKRMKKQVKKLKKINKELEKSMVDFDKIEAKRQDAYQNMVDAIDELLKKLNELKN